MQLSRRPHQVAAALSVLVASACDNRSPVDTPADELSIDCSIPLADVHRGARRGVIPGLANPPMASWGDPDTDYVALEDRVVGVVLDGAAYAIPLKILWWHEIVNVDGPRGSVAVTHCPLTGSSLVFDRSAVAGAAFDVSGLLYENNLVMFDSVGSAESLWPQMSRGARCGPMDGSPLPMVAATEMTLGAWLQRHPDTRIPTTATGHPRDYTQYPYADDGGDPTLDYDYIDNDFTLFPVGSGLDTRRPPKERILGIPDGAGGHAFPFGELDRLGSVGAVNGAISDGPFVVFWDGLAQGAAAFRPRVNGQQLTFRRRGSAVFDDETGSAWGLDGRALSGPLRGSSLEPIADAFVAFWFA